jgi:hypothetical protein
MLSPELPEELRTKVLEAPQAAAVCASLLHRENPAFSNRL